MKDPEIRVSQSSPGVRSMLGDLWRRAKNWVNRRMDKVINWCNNALSDTNPSTSQGLFHNERLISTIGSISLAIKEFPRIDVYIITLDKFSVYYVGEALESNPFILSLIENTPYTVQPVKREFVWNLSKKINQWLVNDRTLVVCDLCSLYLRNFRAPFTFISPVWITQTVDLPENPEEFLFGHKHHDLRGKIQRCCRSGCIFRFTRDKEEFDHFYYKMYVPHAKKKFNELAYIQSYEELFDLFEKEGLILVEQNQIPVAGMTLLTQGTNARLVNFGVLNGQEDLVQTGILIYLVYVSILWLFERGVRRINLGQSLALFSDGPFQFKQKWDSYITNSYYSIRSRCKFYMREPTEEMIAHINNLGVISEQSGKYYLTIISDESETNVEQKIPPQYRRVKTCLSGINLVSKNNCTYIE